MKTIITKKELAERWGVDLDTVDKYEKDGYIRRLRLPGAKYSVSSVELIEFDGVENLIIKRDKEKRALIEENRELREKLEKIRRAME